MSELQKFYSEFDMAKWTDYPLHKDSIVFDIGGYKGDWTDKINTLYSPKIYCFEPIRKHANGISDRFKNNDNITVLPIAISDENKTDQIYVNQDESSVFFNKRGGPQKTIQCQTLDEVMNDYNIKNIDLIKINIEGGEYPLLDYMLANNLVEKCTDISVQFHECIEDYEKRYNNIREGLEKTHKLTFRYTYVWENWVKK